MASALTLKVKACSDFGRVLDLNDPAVWSPLADWPFVVGFDIETVSLSFSTALEFTGGGLPIGDIRFKSMRIIFAAKVSDDLEFMVGRCRLALSNPR
jgi:hypothetical protein